jgi:hypothetical protein
MTSNLIFGVRIRFHSIPQPHFPDGIPFFRNLSPSAVEDQTTTDALNMSGYTFAPDVDDLVTNPTSLMVDVSSGESAPMIVPVDDAASLGMQETMNVQGQSPSAPIDVDLL